MKRSYLLNDLECANCAAKMQDAISKIDGVTSANVSFMTQKLTIEAPEDELDEILIKIKNIIKKIEPDCSIKI